MNIRLILHDLIIESTKALLSTVDCPAVVKDSSDMSFLDRNQILLGDFVITVQNKKYLDEFDEPPLPKEWPFQ